MPRISLSFTLPLLLATLSSAGCAGAAGRVVGTWKGRLEAPAHPKSVGEAFTGLATAFIGDITFEFNKEGRFKESISFGSEEGTYSISGNEVKLVPDDPKHKPSTFILDGDSLSEKKEFASDPDFVLKRAEPGA